MTDQPATNSPEKVDLTNELSDFNKLLSVLERKILAWGLICIPEHFRDKPARFQMQLINAVRKYNELAVVAPRGHSKTTLLSFLYPLHCIYHKKKRYIVLTGYTKEKAAEHISAISDQIKNNKFLKMFYGEIEITRDSAQVLELRHQDGFAIRVHAFGAEQLGGKRGGKFGAYRPDLIILDDIDDDKLVNNPERRRELQRHIDDALFPMGDKHTQYIAVGTRLHFDCQISKMVHPDQYTAWHKMEYKAVIDEATQEVLWKECRTFEWLMQKKKDDPITFAKEYQNDPTSGELKRFSVEMFNRWEKSGSGYSLYNYNRQIISKGDWINCIPVIACDLAWSEKKSADETVIMSSLLTHDSNIIVYNYINERGMRPQRFANLLFEQVNHLHSLTNSKPKVGLEKAMLERVQKHLLKSEMRKRNQYFIVKDLKWETDKISRIEVALEARYSNGIMFHKSGMGDLENQLIQFPSAPHDDLCDSLSGCVQLLKYSKNLKKSDSIEVEDPGFDWLMKNAMPGRKKKVTSSVGTFLFGKKNRYEIPSRKSFMGGG